MPCCCWNWCATIAINCAPLQIPDAATRKLAALVELRRDLVDRRTQVLLQLMALLKSYFPQAL